MPGDGDPVGGSMRATDDGRGNFLPGAAEGTGPVQGFLVGNGCRIFGGAQDDT